jgi:anti-sigma regulatory factor (Ser/Thr protein kinase)
MEHFFQYPSKIQEIPKIREDVANLAAEWQIPQSELTQLTVIVEEIFSNIVRFAYEDSDEHQVQISFRRSGADIYLEIQDDGVPFNPLEYLPNANSDPATSNAGGMGITLVKTFSDSLSYTRIGQKNHLEIVKRIKSIPGS